MERKTIGKALIVIAAVFFVLFAGFTYLVMTYDVADVGCGGSAIGFSSINTRFNRAFGFNEKCFLVTEYLGYFCLGVAFANAVIAFINFVKVKGRIGQMHRRYVITMVFYAVVAALYVLFLIVVINYRPIMLKPDKLESSYPSSHVMLAMCVMASEIAMLHYSARRLHFWAIIFQILCFVCMVAVVVLRLLSGVHWLTDIIGSGLLSLCLISLYSGLLVLYGRHHFHHHHR